MKCFQTLNIQGGQREPAQDGEDIRGGRGGGDSEASSAAEPQFK